MEEHAGRTITNGVTGLIQKGFVELNPEYQRDVVWDSKRSSGLIQSLMAGYFIPPIIFNVQEKEGRKYRICVDGKQRLSSISMFMRGEIGFDDSSSPPKKWYYCNPTVDGVQNNTNHLIMPPKTRALFRNRAFCCYEFQNLSPSVEENMFQLVQRGMPLSPAEKMRALSTQWAILGKKFETDYPMIVNLNNTSRAAGFRMVVSIFGQIIEVDHPGGNGVSPGFAMTPAKLTNLIKNDALLTEKMKRIYKNVFEKFQELLDACLIRDGSKEGYQIDNNSCFGKSPESIREAGLYHVKTFSPLEVLCTAILIHMHSNERNNNLLMGDIMDMRIVLRENHKDLRLNTACWASAWNYINNDLFLRRGGEGVTRRYIGGKTVKAVRRGAGPLEDEEDHVAAPVAPMIANSSSTAQSSRKRVSDSNLDDIFAEDDNSPPPRRRKASFAAAAQMDGVHDDRSSAELVDVKPSVADLNITPIIQPRKRISIAVGTPDSHHLAKRTKPMGRNMQ